MCRECRQYYYEEHIGKLYYKDPICMVFRGNNGEVISIYRHHYSPSPKDEKWIALKGEVAAKRIFSQNLVEARHYYDHFKVIFKPMPQARVMARRKGLDRWNERRDLE